MADTTRKVLQLTFLDGSGKEVKLTINKPNEALTGPEISLAMDQVIAANALGEASVVVSKSAAQYVVTTNQVITL